MRVYQFRHLRVNVEFVHYSKRRKVVNICARSRLWIPEKSGMRELVWVDTEEALVKAVEDNLGEPLVALDAEMDSYYCYRTKLCLVQMTVGKRDYLIDSLALESLAPLNRITEDPNVVKVFHAGENDVPYFRKHGVEFTNIFDTHIAAKILELSSKSLGGLVDIYFEIDLPKDQSRADWRIRPLPDEQVEYARQDTLYLCELAELLQKELEESDSLEEARQYFSSIESLSLREKVFDPETWGKIKGSRDLSGVQRSILSEIFVWREKLAEEKDLAVFRIAHNGALISLSRKRFTEPSQLKGWAKNDYFRDHASELISLMKKGRERGSIPFPDLRKKKNGDWSPADEKLFNVLRQWRNEESERRGVDPSRVLCNKQLKKVARKRPSSDQCLRTVDGLEAWKVDEFGNKLIELVGATAG